MIRERLSKLTAAPQEARRLRLLVSVLASDRTDRSGLDADSLWNELATVLDPTRSDHIWLALTVLRAQLPTDADVLDAMRAARLDGVEASLLPRVRRPAVWPGEAAARARRIIVVSDSVIVDVSHTMQSGFATGIQRVVREVVAHWVPEHDPILVAWSDDLRAMRLLSRSERRRTVAGSSQAVRPPVETMVVPWHSTYVLPELAVEPERVKRTMAMCRHSGSETSFIGYDCVPLTIAETTASGMSGVFAGFLAMVREGDRLAAISHTAALEYRGWQRMLTGAGVSGPQIAAVPIATDASISRPADQVMMRRIGVSEEVPYFLVVGSHEPRKNHLAVLHCAEVLWSRGLRFQLVFVGGRSWNSDPFDRRLAELTAARRPIIVPERVSDDLLWGLYKHARAVVFPSLNEGFGLPIAEALALGTPVVTSGFGAMAEVAETGGALLADPRDDASLAAAMESILVNSDLYERLRREAADTPTRSWDQVAAEMWDVLVEGKSPC